MHKHCEVNTNCLVINKTHNMQLYAQIFFKLLFHFTCNQIVANSTINYTAGTD